GLGVALLGVTALAVAVLALARELGELRLAGGPEAGPSLAHEGPALAGRAGCCLEHGGRDLGGRLALIDRFEGRAPIAVATFTSPGCSLCAALEPSLRLRAARPGAG